MKFTNFKTLETKLSEVQKLSRTRTFDSLEEIENLLSKAENVIHDMERRSNLKIDGQEIDVIISAYHGGRFPNCYKGVPETTFLYFKRNKKNNYTFYSALRNRCNQSATYEGYYISFKSKEVKTV